MKNISLISLAVLSANSSILLSFITRMYEQTTVPIIILRIATTITLIGMAVGTSKRPYIICGIGLTFGWILGYWDELNLLYEYQFVEVFLLPIVFSILLLLLGVTIAIMQKSYGNKI